MSLHCLRLLRVMRSANIVRNNVFSTSLSIAVPEKNIIKKEFRTEENLIYYEDPDKFGTLSPRVNTDKVILEDEGDIIEEKFIKEKPLPSQKLTTRQYADLIKQYLKHKRLKEALNVLEVRMLEDDRVKPENYIYNILIGACADVGYTKKAFKLFNDMKRRALMPTGDTYTCLFEACSNSPFQVNSLKLATNLRELMIEKGIEPNLTNYNAMIKAFGRSGDLPTAFKIVDEMVSKKIKIRVHTFNHLLHACISDKENGLRHGLIVWRKMLKMREKPNIYSFNLMLKCVKECNLGSQGDIEELISAIKEHTNLIDSRKQLQIESTNLSLDGSKKDEVFEVSHIVSNALNNPHSQDLSSTSDLKMQDNLPVPNKEHSIPMQIVKRKLTKKERTLPNLLSNVIQMQQVLSLQAVNTPQDKFAVVGGQEDFIKEMDVYSVKPDIKTFTQMLPLLENSTEAENKLLDTMNTLKVRADIDFYNMLIKKRCLRLDYDAAFKVTNIIKKEGRLRKRLHPDRKKLHLKPNIMTYGVLAMACKTKEEAETLLNDMKEEQTKVNIEILGTLLRHGTAHCNFGYVLYIMNSVKDYNLEPNPTFLKHLEAFHEKCRGIIKPEGNSKPNCTEVFVKTFYIFSRAYKRWLQDVNFEEILKPENPWAQFKETYPETIQRQNIEIKQPKKFYKRTRKYIKYKPTVEL